MGYFKDLMIEMHNNYFETELAKALGLTFEELNSLDYDVNDVTNNDGVLYGYDITFNENSPPELLKKVRGLRGRKVYIEENEIDRTAELYYDEQFDAITSSEHFYASFNREIENLRQLSTLRVDNITLRSILLRQVFISVFGTLEIFLADTFINTTLGDDAYLRKFVENYPEFKQRKFELREVFSSYSTIKEVAIKVMLDVIYHDLPKVREMYMATFNIAFPSLKSIMKYVSVRHDLVHRNGKTKAGEKVKVDDALVASLINDMSKFVEEIAKELRIGEEDLPF